MATRQLFLGHVTLGASDYRPIDGRWLSKTSFENAAHRWAAPCVAKHLHVKLDTAPGSGKSRTFHVLVDEVAVLTVTLSNSETEASVTGSTAIAEGAFVCIRHINSSSPATDARITFVCDHTIDGVSVYGGGGGIGSSGANTGLFSSGSSWDITGATLNRTIAPAAGTIDRLRLDLNQAVPAGEEISFVISNNGSTVAGPFDITEGLDTLEPSINLAFAAGDLLLIHATPSWMTSGLVPTYGIRVSGVDGESFMCSQGTSAIAQNATRYAAPTMGGGTVATIESEAVVDGALASFAVRDFYVRSDAGTFSLSAITFTMRINGVATALTKTTPALGAFGEATVANLDDEITVGVGDALALQFVTGSNWFQGRVSWAAIQYALVGDEDDDLSGVPGPLRWVELQWEVPGT